MISRALLAFLAGSLVAAADGARDFARETLGIDVPVQVLPVTGDVARLYRETVGSPAPRDLSYYHSASNGTVWMLVAPGKHGPITGAFMVEGSRIRSSRIIEDRERRGRSIRGKRYLRQFEGLGLRTGGQLERPVNGITGATVSSRAVERMALFALRLDARAAAGTQSTEEQKSDE